ncbi:MAG: beta-eliminating lyase-related protein, partial [Bacillus sp. (in: firmicutes)]
HMVKPKLVYISNSTEIGTIYCKKELVQLNAFCHQNQLILFMDGARLGSALCSTENDLRLSDLPELVDAFYIGGTKNGALLGEALVICRDPLKADFRFHMKQKGALLAKGRLLGIQFLELFRDDLFFELATHSNRLARKVSMELAKCGVQFLTNSPSNQVFPILTVDVIHQLQSNYDFHVWDKVDARRSAIRLVTSWATPENAVNELIEDIKRLVTTKRNE